MDAFKGLHRLAELQYQVRQTLEELEFLALPTTGTTYTLEDLEREPVFCNSNLGYYTNFVNLLTLSALALPAGFRPDGLPFGITLIGGPGREYALLEYGMRWQRAIPLPLGRTASALPPLRAMPEIEPRRISLAVIGAHMSDFPLNKQLINLGGRLERSGKTAPIYRLFALPGGPPRRPGMVRVAEGGAAIELEVWSLPAWGFGDFVAEVSSPLSIGTVLLDDGSSVQGFLCESYATESARDITEFGGWRSYVKTVN